MNPGTTILLVLVAVMTAIITRMVLAYSIRRSVIDVPNERSSHTLPTPGGGGLGIALVVIIFGLYLYFERMLTDQVMLSVGVGGGIMALTGWIDDHRTTPALWRILVQIGVAVFVVAMFGGLSKISIGAIQIELGQVGNGFAVVAIVWLINLYNFMDGTDGIAAIQAVSAGILGGLLFLSNGEPGLGMMALSVASASFGFLVWNWPPAKIFMGDTGSYFLGTVFVVLAIAGEKSGAVPWLVWVILLSVFIWDATLTLLRRMLAGEKWYSAHRDHAYQRLVQMGYSHRRVALLTAALSVLLMWPLACYGVRNPAWLPWFALASTLIVVTGCLGVHARYRHNRPNSE